MIVFCGHGRSGKDTAAFMFSQITGLKYAGSISWVHKSIVAEQLSLPEQIAWDTRHDNRLEWRRILDDYRTSDPAVLVRNCTLVAPILSGIRNFIELQAAMAEGLIKIAVWVERPGIAIDPTVTYNSSNCTHVLNNSGDLSHLKLQLIELANATGLNRS